MSIMNLLFPYCRVKSYIDNGWADKVVNPDAVFGNTCSDTSSEQKLQSQDPQAWKLHIQCTMFFTCSNGNIFCFENRK